MPQRPQQEACATFGYCRFSAAGDVGAPDCTGSAWTPTRGLRSGRRATGGAPRAGSRVREPGTTAWMRRRTPLANDRHRRNAMTDTPTLSKRALLDALHASRDEVLTLIRSMTPAQLEEGRYEQGWNGRQILAHVASIEW